MIYVTYGNKQNSTTRPVSLTIRLLTKCKFYEFIQLWNHPWNRRIWHHGNVGKMNNQRHECDDIPLCESFAWIVRYKYLNSISNKNNFALVSGRKFGWHGYNLVDFQGDTTIIFQRQVDERWYVESWEYQVWSYIQNIRCPEQAPLIYLIASHVHCL